MKRNKLYKREGENFVVDLVETCMNACHKTGQGISPCQDAKYSGERDYVNHGKGGEI